MKSIFLLPMVAVLVCIAAVSSAQNTDFQTGKIVSTDTIDSSTHTGGTDAPTAANRQKHNLSIELGGTIYVCRVETTKDYDLGWAQGKEVQVRVKGKTMDVKRENGKVVKLSILSTKTSG
jgi:hypothetical protein